MDYILAVHIKVVIEIWVASDTRTFRLFDTVYLNFIQSLKIAHYAENTKKSVFPLFVTHFPFIKAFFICMVPAVMCKGFVWNLLMVQH